MARHTSFLMHLLLSKREKKRVSLLSSLLCFPLRIRANVFVPNAAQRRKAFLRFVGPPRASDTRASRKTNIARKRTDQITRTPVKMRPDFGDATLFEASGCNKIFLTSHLPDVAFCVTLSYYHVTQHFIAPYFSNAKYIE